MPRQYGPLKKKLFVDIAEYNKAFAACEQEKPDPRDMLAIVARFMEANARAFGCIRNAHDAVLGFPWDIVPSDPENQQAVIKAAELKERFILSGLPHFFDVIIDGEFTGMTALRQLWAQGKLIKGKWIAQVDVVPSTSLCYTKNAEGLRVPALIVDSNHEFKAEEITERKQYIISHFNPFKSTRPDFVGGLCRAAIPLTIIKGFSWQDWAAANERHGEPARTAEYKTGASAEDKAAAKKFLANFNKNSWGLFSDTIKFQLHEASRAGSVAAWEKLLEKIDAELAILFDGTANTTELPKKGGSRAAVQTLKLISDDRMWFRLMRLEQIVNEQHVNVDWLQNESETDNTLRPQFKFTIEEEDDRQTNAQIVNDLVAAGYSLDDAEVSTKCGFTVTRATATPQDDGV